MVASATVHPEVKMRFAIMKPSIKPLANRVLSRPELSNRTKVVHAQAYLFSKGLYNACVWPALSVAEHRSLHANVMKVYKHMIRDRSHAH
eukprot:2912583-Karenia_brevis.AAC.1